MESNVLDGWVLILVHGAMGFTAIQYSSYYYRVGVYFIKALHLFHTVKFEHIILRLENILYHQPTIQHAYLLYLYSIIMNYFSSF